MTNQKLTESSKIFQEFQKCSQLQYNGALNIRSSDGKQWNFYYRQGQLVWATGGTHPGRRWRRHVTRNFPQIDIAQVQLSAEDISLDYWDYILLESLYKKEIIRQEQIKTIAANIIAELLFDIAQQVNFGSLICKPNPEILIEAPISSISASKSTKQVQDLWCKWSVAGLGSFSPNLAPVLRNRELLQRQVSPVVYKNFEKFINGKYTLWDLAMKMKQSVLPVASSLLLYINKGIIELVEAPDLALPFPKVKNKYNPAQIRTVNAPLIACVDDSLLVCRMLESIITSHGLRCISIKNAVEALPILIQNKPDLIFLDLMMPVVNGYEICAQLRRTSIFADTPVAILTGSEGLFDKVRSKVYGATDFITKPVETNKVMAIVDKYLQTSSTVDDAYNLALSY